jgi:hypothetical protein
MVVDLVLLTVDRKFTVHVWESRPFWLSLFIELRFLSNVDGRWLSWFWLKMFGKFSGFGL